MQKNKQEDQLTFSQYLSQPSLHPPQRPANVNIIEGANVSSIEMLAELSTTFLGDETVV